MLSKKMIHNIDEIKKTIGWIEDCHNNCVHPFCPSVHFKHYDGNFEFHHTHKLTDDMTKKLCNCFSNSTTYTIEKIALITIEGPYIGDKKSDYKLNFYTENQGGIVFFNDSRHILKRLNDHFVDVNKMVK